MTKPIVVLFREDLRLSDNPALHAAASSGWPVIALYVFDPHAARSFGAAKGWALHHALVSLRHALRERYGVQLVLRRGQANTVVRGVMQESGAAELYWNRRYDEAARQSDTDLKETYSAKSFNASLLFEPWTVKPGSAPFYKVFTPFWKACRAKSHRLRESLPRPAHMLGAADLPSDKIETWGLLPHVPNWAASFSWEMSEEAAHKQLQWFLDVGIHDYKEQRNRPDLFKTSRLSPYLALGLISPFQIWHAAQAKRGQCSDTDLDNFLSEIGWREFSYHLLYHLEDLPGTLLRKNFQHFPWREDPDALRRWQRGLTGYPIVDAGMRELWHSGWMHNRVRMIVASFLIKHLLIDWRRGEEWFWDTLVDADLANNSASWQWVSGGGADASPYFRIFNPITQGEKFDPDGQYTRRWVPELKNVSNAQLFKPWTMTPMEQRAAGVVIGQDYPAPIVDHKAARERALAAYGTIK